MFSGRGTDGGEQWSGQAQEGVSRALPSLIQDSELVLGEKLGSGSFGVVKRGEWHTPTGRVVRDSSEISCALFSFFEWRFFLMGVVSCTI